MSNPWGVFIVSPDERHVLPVDHEGYAIGTGSGYLVNNGPGYPAGTTSIALGTGTGTILAGDVVTFTGDTNGYVVATALGAGVVVLAAPGLIKAVANGVAVTVSASRNPSFGFART